MEEQIQKHSLLLAEDDPHLGQILKIYLESKGFKVTLAVDGEECFKHFLSQEKFKIILLDVMMPKKDGFTIATEIRKKDQFIPIIFITAKAMQIDILEGFRLGADDYITKPFTMEELMARVNAVISRTYKDKSDSQVELNIYNIGNYVFDYQRQVLKFKDIEQKITTREADLLRLLCNYSNQILDRKIALELIWGEDNYFHARNMDVYISKIRKYLKKDKKIELINIHGVGFKLIIS